jgi:hypothetical protein
MAGSLGHGRRRHVPNEKVPYHACSVRDVMIEYLQGQVAKLTQHLAAQNIEMHCDIDDHNLESNFKNPYHNHVLG